MITENDLKIIIRASNHDGVESRVLNGKRDEFDSIYTINETILINNLKTYGIVKKSKQEIAEERYNKLCKTSPDKNNLFEILELVDLYRDIIKELEI